MTDTQAQIIELFRSLPEPERRELAEELYEQTLRGAFFDRMTPEQRAQLDAAVAEADRGEGTEASTVMNRLAQKFGLPRSA